MASVWSRLESIFPRVRRFGQSVWLARRAGDTRRLIEGDERFASVRNPCGPGSEAEWELLGIASLESAGLGVFAVADLYRWGDVGGKP